jgi:hypothetical protein
MTQSKLNANLKFALMTVNFSIEIEVTNSLIFIDEFKQISSNENNQTYLIILLDVDDTIKNAR